MTTAVRYWAFLSYSHADRRDAERLHRALEGYRIPQRLVGRNGPFGPVPARLHPVFRDRDELTASGHIGAVVEAALAASRAMVVLCSPAAAGSRWVDAEITAFQRLRPGAPVLCVWLGGEPLASRDADVAALECLPQSLRTRFGAGTGIADAAPVAVDLRPQGDGWRLGVQKLVAGLAGVPLDQLVQRDAHRRHLRMAWLSAALGVIAIALGAMAVFAFQARDAAREQRAQAEGLIEFMLGDLTGKLKPVGRLDAMEAVGKRALQYYDSQDPRSLDADSLGRRARSQHLVGQIDVLRGDTSAAVAAFHRARDTTAELLARAPDDPQRLYEHLQSVFWVAQNDWQHGDTKRAEAAFVENQHLAKKLVAIDPVNPTWQAELAYAHNNLAVMLMDQGRTQEAITQFEMSRRVNAQRLARQPADTAIQLDLGSDYSWLSSAHALELRFDRAVQERRREIALYVPILERDPRHAVALERIMIARRFLADLHIARGELDAAAREIAETNRLVDAQLGLEPANTDWLRAAIKTRLIRAQLLGWRGQARPGLDELERARPLLADLLARDAELWAWRVELQEGFAQVESDLLLSLGRRDDALRVAMASVSRLQDVMKDAKVQDKTRRWLAASAGRVARIRADQGDRARAREAWSMVVDAVGVPSLRLDAEAMSWLARARAAQGATAAAETLQRQLHAAGYAHPDFTDSQPAEAPAAHASVPTSASHRAARSAGS